MLAEQIADYYFTHIQELPPEQRFHWASRLASWDGDPRAKQLLETCRSFIVPPLVSLQALEVLFDRLIASPLPGPGKLLAYNQRKPYFDAYTPLYGLEQALFRLRHLEVVYGIDARQAFLQAAPWSDLETREQRLLNDPDAMHFLSTYAINYIYLLRRVVLQYDTDSIDPQIFYDLYDEYDLANKEELRLLVYLYTHCIIADSNFYVRPVVPRLLPVYRAMLGRLDSLITEHYDELSLDTKLEYLVCCRICSHEAPLASRIYSECERSVSPQGTFLVDTHNAFAGNPNKSNFAASEHRNVLFVMSTKLFVPTAPLPGQAA